MPGVLGDTRKAQRPASEGSGRGAGWLAFVKKEPKGCYAPR